MQTKIFLILETSETPAWFLIPFEQSNELITVIEITPLSYTVKETYSYRSILLVNSRFCDVLTSIAMSKKNN